MANSNEPKKETVCITVSRPPSTSTTGAAKSRETVRIHLPSRPPANPPSAPAGSPSPPRAVTAAMPPPMTPSAPKKETARVMVLPDPQPKPGVQMKPQPRVDQIPMPLCWTLLAVSATILILQIWNYLS